VKQDLLEIKPKAMLTGDDRERIGSHPKGNLVAAPIRNEVTALEAHKGDRERMKRTNI